MKAIFAIAAAVAAMGSGLPAGAQTQPNIAVAPADRSTGPTILGPRSVDQNTTMPPPNSAATSNANDVNYGNWRTSDGFNNDPNNPTGAPGPSSGLGTSPTR
jgi:hypothetical protein